MTFANPDEMAFMTQMIAPFEKDDYDPRRTSELVDFTMKKQTVLASIALLSCVTLSSAYSEVRIATVDVSRIVNDSPDAVSKKKELDSYSTETKKKIEAKGKELQALKTLSLIHI